MDILRRKAKHSSTRWNPPGGERVAIDRSNAFYGGLATHPDEPLIGSPEAARGACCGLRYVLEEHKRSSPNPRGHPPSEPGDLVAIM